MWRRIRRGGEGGEAEDQEEEDEEEVATAQRLERPHTATELHP